METDLIGTTEAAEILGVSVRTVKRYALAGAELTPFTKIGGGTGPYVFKRSDVEALRDRRAADLAAAEA